MFVFLLLMLACVQGPIGGEPMDEWAVDLEVRPAPAAVKLTLEHDDPVWMLESETFRIGGAQPGARVILFSSFDGVGEGPCLDPPGEPGPWCLDLRPSLYQLDSGEADDDGSITFRVVMDESASNRQVYFQAAARTDTEIVVSPVGEATLARCLDPFGCGSVGFVGYAWWTQNVNTQSDADQDEEMHRDCEDAFPGSAAATVEDVVDDRIVGLPPNNDSGGYLMPVCPDCEGDIGWYGAIDEHCRLCVTPGGSWPTDYYPADSLWYDYCCSSSRTALCVD